jgi:hypothetical protein
MSFLTTRARLCGTLASGPRRRHGPVVLPGQCLSGLARGRLNVALMQGQE